MGHRWLLSGLKDQNTVVEPYFDHEHWMLFVLEDTKTYHFGVGMDVHDNMWANDCVTLFHVAYATARGKNPGHADWWRVVAHGVSKYSWGGDYPSWECGYVMAYMFWQYAKRKQGAKQARLPKEFKFPQLTGRQLQVWFLGVVHRELICQDRRYDNPRLSFLTEHEDFMTILDIPVVSDFAVILDDGSRDFGLDIMAHVRTLKDYSVTRPGTWRRRTPISGSAGWRTRKRRETHDEWPLETPLSRQTSETTGSP
jgi:hypothetical protein